MLRALRIQVCVVVAGCAAFVSCGGGTDESTAGESTAGENSAAPAGTTREERTAAADVTECELIDQAAVEALFGIPLHFVGADGVFGPPIESSMSCSFWEHPNEGYVGNATIDRYPSAEVAAEDYDKLVAEYGDGQCWAGEEGGFTEVDGIGERAIVYSCGALIFALQGTATIALGVDGGRELPDADGYVALASDIADRLAAG